MSKRPLHHARVRVHSRECRERAVRIVAIRALHEAFVDAMVRGHLKLRADIGVAAVAGLVLLLGQQKLGRGGVVNGVTTRARDAVERMLRSAEYSPYSYRL